MPIFMDRHDVPNATPEAVAAAHQADLAIQTKYSCNCMTYWCDEQRGTAFCLIEAPDADAVRQMHRDAHGLIPLDVMEVDPTTVAAFLGRLATPAGHEPIRETAFRAIMFTDMVGFTDVTATLGDAAAYALLQTHHDIIRQDVEAHGGTEIDRAGDGFLLCFSSVTKAVACAVAVQQSFAAHNAVTAGHPIHVRIGLGAGEPVTDGQGLFGSTVNLTARVCGPAGADQILATTVVRELAVGKHFTLADRGKVALKGFDEPVPLCEVVWQGV